MNYNILVIKLKELLTTSGEGYETVTISPALIEQTKRALVMVTLPVARDEEFPEVVSEACNGMLATGQSMMTGLMATVGDILVDGVLHADPEDVFDEKMDKLLKGDAFQDVVTVVFTTALAEVMLDLGQFNYVPAVKS